MADRSKLFIEEARSYYRSAKILRGAEGNDDICSTDWENRNPIYFLILHATELGLKAIGIARGHGEDHSHDIVALARKFSKPTDRSWVRRAYAGIREQRKLRIKNKWQGKSGAYSVAASNNELAKAQKEPIFLMNTLRLLGALGQSGMKKIEFGEEVTRYWHSARYPRFGTTSYPDFEECAVICEGVLRLADAERSALKAGERK